LISVLHGFLLVDAETLGFNGPAELLVKVGMAGLERGAIETVADYGSPAHLDLRRNWPSGQRAQVDVRLVDTQAA